MTSEFYVQVHTRAPLASEPRITEFYHSTVDSPRYYSSGRQRATQQHCIFHYTIRGRGETWRGNDRYFTEPGVGFLHIINDADGGYRYPPDADGEWEFIVLCLEGGPVRELVREMLKDYGPLYALPLTSPLIRRLVSHEALDPAVTLSPADAYGLFASLLTALLKSRETIATSALPPLILGATRYIEEHAGRAVTVGEVAAALFVSREHLSREFVRCTGGTLKEYLQKKRCARICALLRQTNLSVKEIAECLQFRTDAAMIAFFKKRMLRTPAQYRRYGAEGF